MCSPLDGGGSEANLDRCARRFVGWMQEHGYASASRDAVGAAAAGA
jgi:hypothetical protein